MTITQIFQNKLAEKHSISEAEYESKKASMSDAEFSKTYSKDDRGFYVHAYPRDAAEIQIILLNKIRCWLTFLGIVTIVCIAYFIISINFR